MEKAMTGDYYLRRYSPIAYNILRDGEVVALSNMLMNKRWNLRDGNDRALTDRTFATPKEAFQFFLSEMAPGLDAVHDEAPSPDPR